MKQTFLIVALILSLLAVASAQDKAAPAPSPSPETVRLDLPAQQELADSQRQATEARAAVDWVAVARYETAQQKFITALYKVMAELGLKPSGWVVRQDAKGVYFERVKPAGATASPSPPVAQPPAKPKP